MGDKGGAEVGDEGGETGGGVHELWNGERGTDMAGNCLISSQKLLDV